MSLSKKYNIPQESVNRMIKDGWISCSAPTYEKIYEDFVKTSSSSCKNVTAIYMEIADKHHVSEKTVRDVINRFK